MAVDTFCPACGHGSETVSHILLHCPIAVHAWGQSPLKIDNNSPSFRNLLSDFLCNCPGYGATLFATLAWNLWKARNALLFDKKLQEPSQVVDWTMRMMADISAGATKQGRQTAYQPPRTSWSHPTRGTLKLNSDAGVFSDGSVGLGFVVRDSLGEAVMAGAK
ncbi:hypothetical protein ACS0TY_017340 [Phlomoides rotata]